MKREISKFLFLSVLILFLVFSLFFISADDTHVVVEGMKGYIFNITLNVINPNSEVLITSIENSTNSITGLADFYYTSAAQPVTYYVVARSNGKIIATRTSVSLGNFSTGAGLTTIDLFPATTTSTTPPTTTITIDASQNDTSESAETNETTDTQETPDGNSTTINLGELFNLSGKWASVKSFSKVWLPRTLYAILGIVVLCGLGYLGFFLWKRRKKSFSSGSSMQKLSLSKKSENLVMSGDNERFSVRDRKLEQELDAAEKKIKEAQEEIAKIRNQKSKLTEAQRRFEEAKKQLEDAENDL